MEESEATYLGVRWYNSLIFRVTLLCAVLLLCLLGSVYVITKYYYLQLSDEMNSRTEDIANDVDVYLDANPDADLGLEDVREDLTELSGGVPVILQPVSAPFAPPDITPMVSENEIVMLASRTITWGDQPMRLTAQFTLTPQIMVVRAFKNRYLIALTIGFVVTLALMIWAIAKTLKPLGELSKSCERISSGNLEDFSIKKNYGEVLALEQTFNSMVASLRDKELVESKLRQTQRLSSLGTLAAGVAHDVRNPLNSIKLLSSHAIDILSKEERNASTVKQLETIRNEVNRLENIVSGFLSLAKESELQPEKCNVDELLGECALLVQKDAEARKVRMSSDLRGGETVLMLDPKHWKRAIMNVLINALEVCPEGRRVRLFSRLTDTTYEIEIRDDGPGMSSEVLEKAFDPYFTTKATGTGLGLSITRGIVEEHDGKIELSTGEGQGCQVLITLPLRK